MEAVKLDNDIYERCCIQGDVTRGQRSHEDAHEGAILEVIVRQVMTERKGNDAEFGPDLGNKCRAGEGRRLSSLC